MKTYMFPRFHALSDRYPTNYPIREYQYDIVATALLRNTLVSLPTGLGKTFIAAVVMFNFYRWFPAGKVVFMAPTKPLVTQQIGACYDIVGIPHVRLFKSEVRNSQSQRSCLEAVRLKIAVGCGQRSAFSTARRRFYRTIWRTAWWTRS